MYNTPIGFLSTADEENPGNQGTKVGSKSYQVDVNELKVLNIRLQFIQHINFQRFEGPGIGIEMDI